MANLRVSPSPRATRWGLPTAFLSLVALLALSAPAQGTTAGAAGDDPERTQLDETRQHRHEVALELDLLQHSDTELEARLAELAAGIATGEDLLVERQQAIAAADARVVDLEARVEASASRLARQEAVFESRVVSAYIRAGSSDVEVLLGSHDYNEFHERVVLMRQVAGHDRAVLSELVVARDELEADRRAAAAARREASRRATEAEEALAELASQRAEQEAVRDALQERIVAFQAEVDALEADEADLVALIEARAATTTTTLPVTTTTRPPPSSSTSVPATGSTLVTTSSTPTTAPTTTSTVVTTPPTTRPGAPALQWPVAGMVTSPFGPRWGRMHEGIDIGAETGTPIRAAAAGTVILADWFGGYGNAVLVDHGGGYVTLYAHQSSLSVSEGDTVSAGQTVGLVGSTGHSTGPHLHFEVRVGGVAEDPELYLP